MTLNEKQELIERYYIQMENDLLLNIAKKLSHGKPMEIAIDETTKILDWQLQRLKDFDALNEENIKIIVKYSKLTEKEVREVFEMAKEVGSTADKTVLDKGIKLGVLKEIDENLARITYDNIMSNAIDEVLTTFNSQNNSLLRSASKGYEEIVNKVTSEALAGTKTLGNAMEEAVTELSKKGLTGFTARNGAEWTPEAYTKMVIRSNVKNTINKVSEERFKLAGNDYIEINAYSGARPKCSQDQGKIYSLSGNTESITDIKGNKIKVYAWSNSTYGEPDGILGINCGHSRHAFVPNVSIYREKKINKKENDELYMENQQQRLYERTIRNKKREIEMQKQINASKDYIDKLNKKLRDYKNEYNDFLKETGRYRNYSNEWIGK